MNTLKYRYLRPEIQGLRAIAVVSVFLFHIWPAGLPGGYVGVDVFFVISGYLITGGLFREARSNGTISLSRFYARRAMRLLPAATLVLIVVAAGTVLLPETRWEETSFEIAASAIYLQNWALASLSVDYLGSENFASPVQHYWSLSIEEQFYIFWPALIIAGITIARRFDKSFRAALAVTFGITFAVSLACSVLITASEPERAYFLTHVRIWELALGGLLYLSLGHWRPSERKRAILGVSGLAAIILACFLFSRDTAFPGAAALLPTAGAAMVIFGADARGLSAFTLLKSGPLQYIGNRSYSIYLWHWPLIVFYGVFLDRNLNWADGFVVAAATVALSHFSFLLVEMPFRNGYASGAIGAKPLRLGLASILTCLIAAGGVHLVAWRAERSLDERYPGPYALLDRVQVQSGLEPIPSLSQVKKDLPVVYRLGCHQNQSDSQPLSCTLGDPNNRGRFHLVVTGDSHAAQWIPALQVLANKNGWRLTTFTKSNCPFARTRVLNKNKIYTSCAEWREKVIESLLILSPDVVVTSQYRNYLQVPNDDDTDGSMTDGLRKVWSQLKKRGIRVVAIRDTPYMGMRDKGPPECLAARQDSCAVPRNQALSGADPIIAAAAVVPGVQLVDMTDAICGMELCEPVVGNIVVWRDKHHLSATYATALAEHLAMLAGLAPKSSVAMRVIPVVRQVQDAAEHKSAPATRTLDP